MSSAQVIREVYDAFARQDMPRLFDYFAPNIEWYPAEGHPYAPQGRPWIGKDSLAQEFFQTIGAQWQTFGCSPKKFHESGSSTVIVEGRYFGVHKITGRKLDAQFCHVWDLREGKVFRFRQYTDTAQLQAVVHLR